MRSDSFRFKLIMLYFWTIVIPIIIIVFLLPNYFQRLMMDHSMQYTEGIASSLTKNIETYLNELERLTLTPYYDADIMKALKYKAKQSNMNQLSPAEKLKLDNVLNVKFHNFIRLSREDISGTTLVTSDGSIYAKSTDLTSPAGNYPFGSKEWYREALAADGAAVFIGSHKQDYLKQPLSAEVFSVARIIRDTDTESPLAFIIADADTQVLRNLIKDVQFNVSSIIAVLDSDKGVVYSTTPLSESMRQNVAGDSEYVTVNKSEYTMIHKNIGTANWKLVILLLNSEIDSQLRWLYVIGVLFALVGLVLTVIVFFYCQSGSFVRSKRLL